VNRRRVHILYEYGTDLRPHGSAFIRLLRPLTHPALCESLEVTSDLTYDGQDVDAVIVDRLWRPDISPSLAISLVENVRRAGVQLIYALDDNLLDLPARQLPLVSQGKAWPTEEHIWVVHFFLRQADGVTVTTRALQERLLGFNPNMVVVPQALDERLLVGGGPPSISSPFGQRRKVIGYMGTLTHDDDLTMILPALHIIWERHGSEIEFQIVGGVGRVNTLQALKELPVRVVNPRPEEIEYPLFMLWFSSHLRWDIAISPLEDTPFNQCKSEIKFLDYSAIGAAGIYSQVPAYESSVRHLETGWLAENEVDAWVEALEELLSNDRLRMQIAQNATRYLYAERILAYCAHNWLKALEDLLDSA
jgi:glycosyltransferase involved in cell wall biosynthesis